MSDSSSQMDFSVFGAVEIQPLSRIQKIVGSTLAHNWATIPHVTHNEEADISGLDVVRKQLSADSGKKITPLAFMVKAAVVALKQFPHFNASLDGGGNLVLKKYFHIGFAVDTPDGLLVAVIRDANHKSVPDIATEIEDMSARARTKGLPMDQMMGGSFTISSLGSIGGTSFTPIINAPEVAIMGVTRAFRKPFEGEGGSIIWKTMLPLSLSYDHRVINGAGAAGFCLAFGSAMAKASELIDAQSE
jgi:pyruvate dehydrogenase E2 component (dihydrolipoamide acetyltransferase)